MRVPATWIVYNLISPSNQKSFELIGCFLFYVYTLFLRCIGHVVLVCPGAYASGIACVD